MQQNALLALFSVRALGSILHSVIQSSISSDRDDDAACLSAPAPAAAAATGRSLTRCDASMGYVNVGINICDKGRARACIGVLKIF